MVNDFMDMCGALLAIKTITETTVLPDELSEEILSPNPLDAKFRFSRNTRREFARIGYNLFYNFLDAVFDFKRDFLADRAVRTASESIEDSLVC